MASTAAFASTAGVAIPNKINPEILCVLDVLCGLG
jgi:hypothetical protein